AMPSAFTGGGNNQWVQYKVFLTSTGVNTSTLSDITLTYVVNAAPAVQNVTASQGSDGKVSIAYDVKDADTSSGTVNPGYVTPSFSYWNGASWTAINSGLSALATTTKAVNQSTFTSYSTVWTASTTIGTQYINAASIRVTANDNEAANNTAYSSSTPFILDTAPPTGNSVLVSAAASPATITLSSADDSAVQMKVGLTSNLSDASWEAYATSKTLSLSSDPQTVYAKFKDAYGNESSIISAATPSTPTGMMVQDNTNTRTSESRMFVAWNVVALPSPGFGSYKLYRSTDGGVTYSLLTTIADRNTNYYMDTAVTLGATYYYKVATVDASGSSSYYSTAVFGIVNGTQDTSEGGGGVSAVLPVISAVSASNITTKSAVINWTTDKLATSTVGYCAGSCSDFTTNRVSLSSYSTAHSVAIGGLVSGVSYNYKIYSSDISSNLASSTVQTFSTLSGPAISAVSVVNATNVSADIVWNTDISASGYVVYSTTNPPSGNESGSASLATTRTVSLTSLTGGTKYYFYVKSQDGSGHWAYDYNPLNGEINYYTFTTPLDSTPPVFSSVASTTQRTAANISWATDEPSNSKVIYGLTTSYGSETTLDNTFTRIHSVSLSNLLPSTSYHYRVVSADAAGNQASSTDYALITESLSITNIAATTVSNTSTRISWTTSDNSNSQIEYSTFADLTGSTITPSAPSDSTTSHSVTLSSLSQASTYYYRVKSSSNGIATTTSQIYQFTTGDSTPPVVSSITASPVIDTSAVINWTTDEPATSKVQYGINSGAFPFSSALDSTLTRNHSVSLLGLYYGTKYYYQVLSADGSSNATTSAENTFTTLEQQIGKSKQVIVENVAAGGGSMITGVPQDKYDALLKEKDELKANYASLSKENDDLKNKILGINTNASTTPSEVITLVIDKFAEIAGNLTESAITAKDQTQTQVQSEKLEKDILPAVTSLRQLAKLVPPPKLKTEPKFDIGPTEATVSWTTDKPATSVVYFSEDKDYNKKSPDTYTNSAEDSKNYVTDHKMILKGLSPLSDYHYRLMSESEAGARAYSADFTFTTKTEMPKITQAKAEKSGDASIVVSWRTNIPANSAVVYTPVIAGKPDVKKSKSEGAPEFSQEHSITVPRLEPSTVYDLEVSSVDHFGNVAAEKLEPMSIARDETPPIITQVRNESSILAGASSNKVQAIFYWKTDEPATTKVIFAKGAPTQTNEEQFDGKSNLNEDLSLNHIAVITSWEPGEIYRFRAVSADAYGNEAQSKTFTVIAPKQKATVVDLIVNNFSDTFDWTKKLGM
ncbi:MAG: fibronectin type III domain-containing protein, partial [Patescibacteria group bacterium]|nr:fibronectin type III domain-containing protein [Patescibacteria group bacterium]